MKAIVLCERTLVQESKDFNSFKEEKINDGSNVKAEGKKIVNGKSDSKKSEDQVQSSEKDRITLQNGDKRRSKASVREEINENNRSRRSSAVESVGRGNLSTGEADPDAGIERNSLSSGESELECLSKENSSSESVILDNSDVQNGSEYVKDPSLSCEMDCSVENDETSDATLEIKKADKSGSSSKEVNGDSLTKTIETDAVDENNLTNAVSKENVHPLDNIILDLDENKENEKQEKMIVLDDFTANDLSDKHSSGCDIQVGKVETISGTEKESMWAENEFKNSQKDSAEKSEEKLLNESQDLSISNDDSMNVESGKEEENHEFGTDENLLSEGEENSDEEMHIEMEEVRIEVKENEQTNLNNLYKDDKGKGESAHCRKRQMFKSNDEDPSSKKKRLSVDREEENTEDSSRCASLSSLDVEDPSSKGEFTDEAKGSKNTARTLTDGNNLKKNLNAKNEDEKVEKQGIGETMFSVLEKFRGTLKTLTRGDLEELIIQKLCEVITERSNVGELRQKAQALEEDQERWKTKAQSLAKQMREMEMVMKKYMSEVQKQIKEGDSHVVTPLKVTRSVGLQVSFYSSTSKVPKPNLSQAVPATVTPNLKNSKVSSPKLTPQICQVPQNTKNKAATPVQKSPPSLPKPIVTHIRKPVLPKLDNGPSASNKPGGVQQPVLSNGRGTQNQAQTTRPGFKTAAGASPQQSPQLQQQKQPPLPQNQQQQQSGSKVIDLTEDDDKQAGNVGTLVKAPGAIRVVNHLTQPTTPQNNRFAYLLPTTSAPTGTSAGPNRQVLIATPSVPQPNRQIMCSMPPLLFKGGNVVQGGSQPPMLNQSNKVVFPKTLRHPAPLPQRPVNQNTRPSLKLLPPRPALKISKVQTGIVLSWNMSLSPEHAPISSYQLYAYQESDSPPTTSLWKKVGDVKALPLPMACTLTQFMSGHKYHFAVRAVDLHSRIGPFSFPGTIVLV